METSTGTERSAGDSGAPGIRRSGVPGVIDWFVPGVLAILGAMFIIGGAALLVTADYQFIVQQVAQGTIQSDVFAAEHLARITFATMWWSGLGLVVAGVGCWGGAIWFNVHRRRERRVMADGERDGPSVSTSAAVGAATAIVLFFVPFSTALGGLAAGYVKHGSLDQNLTAGALSGLLASLPVAVVLLFTFGGMADGAIQAQAVAGAAFVVGLLIVTLLFAIVLGVATGALGGWVGGRLARTSEDAE